MDDTNNYTMTMKQLNNITVFEPEKRVMVHNKAQNQVHLNTDAEAKVVAAATNAYIQKQDRLKAETKALIVAAATKAYAQKQTRLNTEAKAKAKAKLKEKLKAITAVNKVHRNIISVPRSRRFGIPSNYRNLNNLVIIHVGKCGGSTVCNELTSNYIRYTGIHIRKPIYDPNNKYVIVIRNPIKRFISAFNWRYHLVNNDKREETRFNNEKTILNRYHNVDNLCNDLEHKPNIFNGYSRSSNYVHHLKEDIHFYLNKFIHICPKHQIVGVICTETLKRDMKRIFNIDVVEHAKKNTRYNNNISDKSYKILKEYLKNDYLIIEQMYKNRWIHFKKYKLLTS